MILKVQKNESTWNYLKALVIAHHSSFPIVNLLLKFFASHSSSNSSTFQNNYHYYSFLFYLFSTYSSYINEDEEIEKKIKSILNEDIEINEIKSNTVESDDENDDNNEDIVEKNENEVEENEIFEQHEVSKEKKIENLYFALRLAKALISFDPLRAKVWMQELITIQSQIDSLNLP